MAYTTRTLTNKLHASEDETTVAPIVSAGDQIALQISSGSPDVNSPVSPFLVPEEPTADKKNEPLELMPSSSDTPANQIAEPIAAFVEPEQEDVDDALITQYDPAREAPEGKPVYSIMLSVTGSRLGATLRKAQEAFGDKLLNVEKVSKITSRADQMDEAVGMIQNAKSVCEDLKDQIENWKNNLPENFQDKGSQLEGCMDALEQVINSLDEAESNAESVEFPGMY